MKFLNDLKISFFNLFKNNFFFFEIKIDFFLIKSLMKSLFYFENLKTLRKLNKI
jgi:hypothetical protein